MPFRKNKLATLNLAMRPLNPHAPSAGDAEQRLLATDVFDLATQRRFRQQHTDLPSEVRDAIVSLGGVSAAEHASRGTSGTGAAKHVPPDVIPASKASAEILRTLPQGTDEKRCERGMLLVQQSPAANPLSRL